MCPIGDINTAFKLRVNISIKIKICLEVSEGNFWNFSRTGFQIRFCTTFPLSYSLHTSWSTMEYNTLFFIQQWYFIYLSWWIRINYIIQIGGIRLRKKRKLEYNLQLAIYIPGDDGSRAASIIILFTEGFFLRA